LSDTETIYCLVNGSENDSESETIDSVNDIETTDSVNDIETTDLVKGIVPEYVDV
jgi:hypothetical protein